MEWPIRSRKIAGARAVVVALAILPALLARADFSLGTLFSPQFYLSLYDDVSGVVGEVLATADEGRLAVADWIAGGPVGATEHGRRELALSSSTDWPNDASIASSDLRFGVYDGSPLPGVNGSDTAGEGGGGGDFTTGFHPGTSRPNTPGWSPPGWFVPDPPGGTTPEFGPTGTRPHGEFLTNAFVGRDLLTDAFVDRDFALGSAPVAWDPSVYTPGVGPMVPGAQFLDASLVTADPEGLGSPAVALATPATVPEPGTLLLLMTAGLLWPLAAARRRRR